MSPLALEWQRVSELLANRNVVEIEIVRLAFHLGARSALDHALNPMALMMMRSDIRQFDREVTCDDRAVGAPASAQAVSAGD